MVYEAEGKIELFGCAKVTVEFDYQVDYAVGQRVYVKQKAKTEGILASIVIKETTRNEYTDFSGHVVGYVDTFNRFWLEEELVTLSTAADFAKLYWAQVKDEAEQLMKTGCFSFE